MSDIKYYMSLSVTVGVALVGLLYSFCLAFQWIYGWPDKPGYKKYIEALKPRRIYGLTLATLDLLKYLQYGRLYFQLKSWYEDERNLKYYEKMFCRIFPPEVEQDEGSLLTTYTDEAVRAKKCKLPDIKYYMSLSVTVGVVLVGLLYSFCLAFQWINGWPDKRGYKKYIEALKPRRIYGLTLATLDLLKYLQYGRLYFQLKSWYKDERNLKYYEKGITFGRRGNKLDLYHPPNAGKAEDMKSPVVVFIYGGAWSTGERSTYCLLGRQMAEELKATVICPDYCTYPKGNVLGMVQDVTDCLIWAHQNGEKFNFDKTAVRALLSESQSHKETILSLYGKNSTRFLSPGGHCKKGKNPAFLLEFGSITFAMLEDNIVLVGHSAGAHLCTLVTLFLVDTREELLIESNKCQDILLSIRGIIGLSGVYNIVDHYEHEQTRAVEYVSPMHKAMNGVENFPYYSPAHVLKKLRQDKVNRLPPFVLLHGTNDIMVPVQSTTRFSELLTSRSAKISLYVLPGVSHTEILTDLMVSDRRLYHPIYRYIKQEYRKLLSTC